MSPKRCLTITAAVFIAAALFAGNAFAQKRPQPNSTITVSQVTQAQADDDANLMFMVGHEKTIQAAVNRAQDGDIIEILDTATYSEQVTIDGRVVTPGNPQPNEHPWGNTVRGLKNNITIRFVPYNGERGRPKIVYQDTRNVYPQNCSQAQSTSSPCDVYGDAERCAGNYETNGALRIIRAHGVKIEGLIIDGGGAKPFGYDNVWRDRGCAGATNPLTHGNAAVAVAVSGGIQIRDCELRNAHFGIAVKDRNTGGVFGNPNPSDNDHTIPLSGFGRTGNHLFEYNKIGDNIVGIFFESSWDLGSTVRHNLIYGNRVRPSGVRIPYTVGDQGNYAGDGGHIGGIVFKDNFISPIAIYNNTFYENHAHLLGGWKIGYQHLIFNNIFGKPFSYEANSQCAAGHMSIIQKFPHRMKSNLIAADQNPPSGSGSNNQVQWYNFGTNGSKAVGDTIASAKGNNNEQNVNFPGGADNRWFEINTTHFMSTTSTNENFLVPNWTNTNVLSFIRQKGYRATTGGVAADVAVNDDGTRADLGAVQQNGKRPCDGVPQKSRVRISPESFVTLAPDGAGGVSRNGTASLIVKNEVDGGTISNIKLKYLRWVSPIPENDRSRLNEQVIANPNNPCPQTGVNGCDASWGMNGWIIAADGTGIHNVTITSSSFTGDRGEIEFTLPNAAPTNAKYGFFEIVVEGTDGNDNTVTSDVGFLPYRELPQYLEIAVRRPGGTWCTENCIVVAGEQVEIRVTAKKRDGEDYQTASNSDRLLVEYFLRENTSRMWQSVNPRPSNPLLRDTISPTALRFNKTYTSIYFTKAGGETVRAAGQMGDLPFPGSLSLTVLPGSPANVAFLQPTPNWQLCNAWDNDGNCTGYSTAKAILGDEPVLVQVQDRFGNPVNTAHEVNLKVISGKLVNGEEVDSVGVVRPASVMCDAATGNAEFIASVGPNGATNAIFDMEASITLPDNGGSAADTARLRIGRATDMLRIMYPDPDNPLYIPTKHGANGTGNWWGDDFNDFETIEKNIGEYARVWVKVISADMVDETKNGWVCIESTNDNLRMAPHIGTGTERPDAAAFTAGKISVQMEKGVASLWITSDQPILNPATLIATPMHTNSCDGTRDLTVSVFSRGEIYFNELDISYSAVIYSTDRWGRPTHGEINIAKGENTQPFTAPPQSVTLSWPSVLDCDATPGKSTVTGSNIVIDPEDDYRALVTFRTADFPMNYTTFTTDNPSYSSISIVLQDGTTFGSAEVSVTEMIGPLIAGDNADGQCQRPTSSMPLLTQNIGGANPDELLIQATEGLNVSTLQNARLEVKRDGEPNFFVTIETADPRADGVSYLLTLTAGSSKLNAETDSIRFVGDVTDAYGNKVHDDGRYVGIRLKEVPSGVKAAWYTIDDATGLLNNAYYVFDREIDDITRWFGSGTINFSWDGRVDKYDIPPDPGSGTALTASRDTLVVNLRETFVLSQYPDRWPSSSSLDYQSSKVAKSEMRSTANSINTKFTFNTGTTWGDTSTNAVDKAAPVLVYARLQVGKVDAPDTLTLTFSESLMNPDRDPVSLAGRDFPNNFYTVTGLTLFDNFDDYRSFRYLVSGDDMTNVLGRYPRDGDSVRINSEAALADALVPGNAQTTVNNRKVKLNVDYGDPDWVISVGNNPFKGGTGNDFKLEVGSVTKAEITSIRSEITLYNNMGNVVRKDTVTYEPPQGSDEDAKLVWRWDGRNKDGRYVGTGSYVLVSTSQAVFVDVDTGAKTSSPPMNKRQTVGFVRGKGN